MSTAVLAPRCSFNHLNINKHVLLGYFVLLDMIVPQIVKFMIYLSTLIVITDYVLIPK